MALDKLNSAARRKIANQRAKVASAMKINNNAQTSAKLTNKFAKVSFEQIYSSALEQIKTAVASGEYIVNINVPKQHLQKFEDRMRRLNYLMFYELRNESNVWLSWAGSEKFLRLFNQKETSPDINKRCNEALLYINEKSGVDLKEQVWRNPKISAGSTPTSTQLGKIISKYK